MNKKIIPFLYTSVTLTNIKNYPYRRRKLDFKVGRVPRNIIARLVIVRNLTPKFPTNLNMYLYIYDNKEEYYRLHLSKQTIYLSTGQIFVDKP